MWILILIFAAAIIGPLIYFHVMIWHIENRPPKHRD